MQDPFASDLDKLALPDDFGSLLGSGGGGSRPASVGVLGGSASAQPPASPALVGGDGGGGGLGGGTPLGLEAASDADWGAMLMSAGSQPTATPPVAAISGGGSSGGNPPVGGSFRENPTTAGGSRGSSAAPSAAQQPALDGSLGMSVGGNFSFASMSSPTVGGGGGGARAGRRAGSASLNTSTYGGGAPTPAAEEVPTYARMTPPLAPTPANPPPPTEGGISSRATSVGAAQARGGTSRAPSEAGRGPGGHKSRRSASTKSFATAHSGGGDDSGPSWLDGGDDEATDTIAGVDTTHGEYPPDHGHEEDEVGFYDREDEDELQEFGHYREDDNHEEEVEEGDEEEEEEDELLAAMGISSRSPSRASRRSAARQSSASEKSFVGGRSHRQRELAKQEKALLEELEQLEKQLATEAANVDSLEDTLEAESQTRNEALEAKETEIGKARDALEAKAAENAIYIERKNKEIDEATASELNDLATKFTEKETQRLETVIGGIQGECDGVAKEVEKLTQERELLKMNGAFTEKGVYVAVEDEETLEDKLGLAVELVSRFITESKDFFSENVRGLIRHGTRNVVDAIWSDKSKLAHEEAAARREAFDEFKKESLADFVSFCEERGNHRETVRENFHKQLQASSDQLQELAKKRTQQAHQESQKVFDDLSQEFKQRFEKTMDHAHQKAQRIFTEDEKIAQAQFNEVIARLEMAEQIQKKLLTTQKEELDAHLERERDLLQKGKDVASSQEMGRAAALIGRDAEDIQQRTSELLADIDKLILDQKRYTAVIEGSFDATEPVAASSLASETARKASYTAKLIREREHVFCDLKTAVLAKIDEVTDFGLRCSLLREQVSDKFGLFGDQLRDTHLQIQGELSKTLVIQLQWEKEHRLMLSGGVRVDVSPPFAPNKKGNAAGNGGRSPTNKTGSEPHDDHSNVAKVLEQPHLFANARHHPFIAAAIDVAGAVRDRAAQLLTECSEHQRKREVLLRNQHTEDETLTDHFEKCSGTSTKLFTQLMMINGHLTSVSEQQVKGAAERAKLDIESELLQHDREEFFKKTKELQLKAKELEEASSCASAEMAVKKKEFDSAQNEKLKLEREKDRLILAQRSLNSKQQTYYEEGRRLDHSLYRLQQKKLVTQVAGSSAVAEVMLMNGGTSPNSMNNGRSGHQQANATLGYETTPSTSSNGNGVPRGVRRAFDPVSFLGPDLLSTQTTTPSATTTSTVPGHDDHSRVNRKLAEDSMYYADLSRN